MFLINELDGYSMWHTSAVKSLTLLPIPQTISVIIQVVIFLYRTFKDFTMAEEGPCNFFPGNTS